MSLSLLSRACFWAMSSWSSILSSLGPLGSLALFALLLLLLTPVCPFSATSTQTRGKCTPPESTFASASYLHFVGFSQSLFSLETATRSSPPDRFGAFFCQKASLFTGSMNQKTFICELTWTVFEIQITTLRNGIFSRGKQRDRRAAA